MYSKTWLLVIWLGGAGVVLHRSSIGARRVRRIVAEAAQAPAQTLSLAARSRSSAMRQKDRLMSGSANGRLLHV